MRDFERWKDRVEFSLDGRQIFFLFFGVAVAACLIFVGGVFIGKRVDSRVASPLSADDPLAALDQLDNEEADDGLTFHEALVRDEHRRTPGKDKSARSPVAEKLAHADANLAHAEPVKPNHGDELVRHAPAPPVPSVLAKPALPQKSEAAKTSGAAPKPEPPKKSDAVETVEALRKPPTVAANPTHAASSPSRYTLQLSSFADRSDADAFAQKIRGAGYQPSVVRSEVPGKGTFFRVRVGEFPSKQAADQAKDDYEEKQHAMVYVAPF